MFDKRRPANLVKHCVPDRIPAELQGFVESFLVEITCSFVAVKVFK